MLAFPHAATGSIVVSETGAPTAVPTPTSNPLLAGGGFLVTKPHPALIALGAGLLAVGIGSVTVQTRPQTEYVVMPELLRPAPEPAPTVTVEMPPVWSPVPSPMPSPTPEEEPNWVVRGGEAKSGSLASGYKQHIGALDVWGLSVQYQPGHTVDELAMAGQFRNAQMSYATDEALRAAAMAQGYIVDIVKTPGRGFHYTLTAKDPTIGATLQSLPDDLAQTLSNTFKRKLNPYQFPGR